MRKGKEYMPLSDGLITTGGPRSKASTTAARKLLGTSSPTGAGAAASLERPRPVGIQVWDKIRAVSGGEKGSLPTGSPPRLVILFQVLST